MCNCKKVFPNWKDCCGILHLCKCFLSKLFGRYNVICHVTNLSFASPFIHFADCTFMYPNLVLYFFSVCAQHVKRIIHNFSAKPLRQQLFLFDFLFISTTKKTLGAWKDNVLPDWNIYKVIGWCIIQHSRSPAFDDKTARKTFATTLTWLIYINWIHLLSLYLIPYPSHSLLYNFH